MKNLLVAYLSGALTVLALYVSAHVYVDAVGNLSAVPVSAKCVPAYPGVSNPFAPVVCKRT